jgi:hypothetical protein
MGLDITFKANADPQHRSFQALKDIIYNIHLSSSPLRLLKVRLRRTHLSREPDIECQYIFRRLSIAHSVITIEAA